MKLFITIVTILNFSISFGQTNTNRVLFLGNSYTYYNDLPNLVSKIASSTGDSVIYDSNTPGGHTLQEHSSNAISLNKIAIGNWDYVVLQEQSQRPSLPINQVNIEVFPYAHILDSIIKKKNPCAETMFYMTWGRKNGDADNCNSWPPVCTYNGMDSLLRMRYKMLADINNATISPVSVVWKKVRQSLPLLELYNPDESHPSEAGSYIAACCFYTTIFKKNPLSISFNYTLAPADAANIRQIIKLQVFDSLYKWNVGKYDPKANFTYTFTATNNYNFSNNSSNTDLYKWDFGDGETSTIANPMHQYNSNGTFTVKLTASKCAKKDTIFQTINISTITNQSQDSLDFSIFPNPVKTTLTISKKNITNLSYKIFNAVGSNVKEGTITNTLKQINIASLTNGVYVIQLFENNKLVGKQKVVKISN